MGSGCVIVTFKMLDGDFISLFSYLLSFFYTAFDSNEKKPVMFFSVFLFKRANIGVNFVRRFRT